MLQSGLARLALVGPHRPRLEAIPRRTPILAVDGGLSRCLRAGIRPKLAIGDWDSLTSPRHLESVRHLSLLPDKDQSDLACALALAAALKAREVLAIGVTGPGRADHQLASQLELSGAAKHFERLEAVDQDGQSFFLEGPATLVLKLRPGAGFSVFSLDGSAQNLSIRGARYSVDLKRLAAGSRGLSNEARGARVRLRLGQGRLLVIVPRHF